MAVNWHTIEDTCAKEKLLNSFWENGKTLNIDTANKQISIRKALLTKSSGAKKKTVRISGKIRWRQKTHGYWTASNDIT